MNRADTLLLDSQLCFLLYATTRAVTQAYGPLLAPLGLTYPQYLTMLALWEEDGATVGRLGERLRLDSGTLTPLVKRLEGMALVERRRSPDDERVVQVFLTAAGRRLRAKAEGVPAAMFCQAGLSHASTDRLRADLRRLLTTLLSHAESPATAETADHQTTKPEPKKESQS